jgi:tRNA(Arg) A34 adenosine deaminase TadA
MTMRRWRTWRRPVELTQHTDGSVPQPKRVRSLTHASLAIISREEAGRIGKSVSLPNDVEVGLRTMSNLREAWDRLPEPWQLVFNQAWIAYQKECVPAGAIILDSFGAVVSQAHNRVQASGAYPEAISGTRISHAPLNALVQIPTVTRHVPAALYTTIEPCMMCLGAAILTKVTTVSFASREFYGGATSHILDIPAITDTQPKVLGPLDSPIADLFLHLYVAFHSWISPNGALATAYAEQNPELFRRSTEIAEQMQPLRSKETSHASALELVQLKF